MALSPVPPHAIIRRARFGSNQTAVINGTVIGAPFTAGELSESRLDEPRITLYRRPGFRHKLSPSSTEIKIQD
jgi:hypothetical protein